MIKAWRVFLLTLCVGLLAAHSSMATPFNDIIRKEANLNEAEIATISAGKQVIKVNPDKSLGGIVSVYVNAKPEVVWQAVTDFRHYEDFIPETIKANILKEGDAETTLYAEYHSQWPYDKIIMETVNHFDKSNPDRLLMVWKATKTNMKNGQGYWIVQPHKEGTLLTHGLEFDLNWIPRVLATPAGKKRVKEVVAAVKKRSEMSKNFYQAEIDRKNLKAE